VCRRANGGWCNPMKGMKRRTPFLALVTIVVLSPVVTWWLVGDQSEPDRQGGVDFLFHPLPLSQSQQALIVTSCNGRSLGPL